MTVGLTMSEYLLEISKLSKSFAGIAAIDGADLQVKPGEVHAVIGQNGAGKSTLIKALTGYVWKDRGDIKFGGNPFDVHSPMAAQCAGISTIYQEINLVPMRSVAENICLGREMRRYEEAKRLLGKFGITIDVRTPLSNFSTATQQMVAIARAIGFDAKLVIMDEPTSSLDAREADVLFDVIRKLKESGVAVIYVSHKLDELYHICDRVTIMRDGRTVVTKNMNDVSKLELVSTMLGRDITKSKGKATGFQATNQHDVAQPALLSAMNIGDGLLTQSVSLTLRPGEITALAGLLGSGRTETAQTLFGSSRKRTGEITLQGRRSRRRCPCGEGRNYCFCSMAATAGAPPMTVNRTLLSRNGVFAALAFIIIFGWLRYDNFLSLFNITSVLRYNSMFALIALGMCLVIMAGGIDLSVGSTAALGRVAAAFASPYGIMSGLAAGVGAGLVVGSINALVITRLRIMPFIATLATMLAASGSALLISNKQSVSASYERGFTNLGQGNFAGLPIPILFADCW